jgi:hypothetical protein
LKLTSLVVIVTDCIGISHYNTMMAMMASKMYLKANTKLNVINGSLYSSTLDIDWVGIVCSSKHL